MHSTSCSYDGSNNESANTSGGVGDGCLVDNVQNFHLTVTRYAHNIMTVVNVFHSPKDSSFYFAVLNTAHVAFL